MISVSCSFSLMNRWIGSRIVRLSGTAMVARKRSDGILFWTSIVQAVTARAYPRMNTSLRESKQTYFHDAKFPADAHSLSLKPILFIGRLSGTVGREWRFPPNTPLPGFTVLTPVSLPGHRAYL